MTADAAWLARNRAALAGTELAPQAEAVGRVEQVADGIARVSGLPDARLNELLHFTGGRLGFALTLDADAISAVLLDEGEAIVAGSRVTGTGEVVRVPVGPGLLGRVVDPLSGRLRQSSSAPWWPSRWRPASWWWTPCSRSVVASGN